MKSLLTSLGLLFAANLLYGQHTNPSLPKAPVIIRLSPAPQMGDNQVRGVSLSPTSSAIAAAPQGTNASFKEPVKLLNAILPSPKSLTNLAVTKNTTKTKISIVHSVD